MALTRQDIGQAAAELGVEPALLKAVADVESSGSGFLRDGRPKILFEGHIFWKQLVKRRIDPKPYAARYPTIVNSKWTKANYLGGAREYDRLAIAQRINEEAALCSASWGAFQLMGFNYGAAGFTTVYAFVDAQKQNEASQLRAACRWMVARGLVAILRRRNWADFARAYNGPGYATNKYDARLKEAYVRAVANGWNQVPVATPVKRVPQLISRRTRRPKRRLTR